MWELKISKREHVNELFKQLPVGGVFLDRTRGGEPHVRSENTKIWRKDTALQITACCSSPFANSFNRINLLLCTRLPGLEQDHSKSYLQCLIPMMAIEERHPCVINGDYIKENNWSHSCSCLHPFTNTDIFGVHLIYLCIYMVWCTASNLTLTEDYFFRVPTPLYTTLKCAVYMYIIFCSQVKRRQTWRGGTYKKHRSDDVWYCSYIEQWQQGKRDCCRQSEESNPCMMM